MQNDIIFDCTVLYLQRDKIQKLLSIRDLEGNVLFRFP